MQKNRFAVAAAALLVGGLSSFVQGSEELDTVLLRGGKTQSVEIQEEHWDAIVGKGSPPIPWDGVIGIEYGGAPEFNNAVAEFNAGNYDSALGTFDALMEDPKLRKVFKQQIAFDAAYRLHDRGEYDEAIAAYEELLANHPKGRYHVRAVEQIADCMLGKDDSAGALKAVAGHEAAAAGDAPLASALGLVKARLLLAQNDRAAAKPLFDAAASVKGAPAWVVFEGQLGQAACMLQEGNASGAETRFRELTKAAAPKHVLSGAWNGLGDILSDQGFKKKDIDQLIDALYCYLRGSTVYAPIAGEPTDQYEISLAGSARCFGNVADLIDSKQNLEKKNRYKQYAKERWEMLQKEFPSSRFLEN